MKLLWQDNGSTKPFLIYIIFSRGTIIDRTKRDYVTIATSCRYYNMYIPSESMYYTV